MRFKDIHEGKGISDFRGIRQLAFDALDKHYPRIAENGKGSFTVTAPKSGVTVKVQVGPGLRDEIHRDPPLHRPYLITINGNKRDKADIRAVLAHEITHLSQIFNKSMKHADRLERDFGRQHNLYSQWEMQKRFYSINPVEREARLAQVLSLIGDGEISKAADELWWEGEYFHFSRRDWLRKAVNYGIEPSKIKEVERKYRDEVLPKHMRFYKDPKLADKVREFLEGQRPVMAMLGLDYDHYREMFVEPA